MKKMIEEVKTSADIDVGRCLREERIEHGLSIRALAEKSGLNVNTLSLIENGKTSPSVSTLQQIAAALEVPITAFFKSSAISKRVVYTPHDERPEAVFKHFHMGNLGKDYTGNVVQAFIVTLDPESGSGERMIVHTGNEFVYCLDGKVRYTIEGEEYLLETGDSILFESHLPHSWLNVCKCETRFMLIICSADAREELNGTHFFDLE